ncbi:MAG: FAD:protein FMN transferase [Planctomycetota bacterium]
MSVHLTFCSRKIALVACSFVLFCLQANGDDSLWEMTGKTMGPIQYKVLAGGLPEAVQPEELHSAVENELEAVNQRMSTYIATSDVSRFNLSTETTYLPVDSETAKVVAKSLEISKVTGGAFDVTVGPAVNLWKFGPDKSKLSIPSPSQLDRVKQQIGYQNLSVRLDPPALKKSIPELNIDLSAIAKGYAVDCVANRLDELGCKRFMVEVGGEVVVRGEKSPGNPWKIGLERPTDDPRRRRLNHVIALKDRALATSGDYRNVHIVDGKRYSHTIDATTCRPVTHGVATATVLAEDCMTADALATAILVLGAEKGMKLCEQLNAHCLLGVRKNGDMDDLLIEQSSSGFPDLIAPMQKAPKTNAGSILPVFLGAAVVFGLVIFGMAFGAIFNNKPITGSCGGLANMTNESGDQVCGICSKPTTDCMERVENAVSGQPTNG